MKRLIALGIMLTLSACGPGQLLGPTVTPTPTATATSTPTLTPTATSTPTPTPIALTEAEMKEAVLDLSDLAAGYTALEEFTGQFTAELFKDTNSKLYDYLSKLEFTGWQNIFQQKELTGAVLRSRIIVFKDDAIAQTYLNDYMTLVPPDYQVSELSFEKLADDSNAELTQFKQNGFSYDQYIVTMRRKNVIAQVSMLWASGLGQIDQLVTYATKAEDKLNNALR